MVQNVKIRKFRKGDEFEVAKIIRDANQITLKNYYPSAVIKRMSAEARANKIRKKAIEKNFKVALLGGKIVGFIGLTENRIRSFFVHPSHQGKGIGRVLIEMAESDAKILKMKFIQLNSSLFAVKFYKHFGYKKIKNLKPNKKNGRWFEVVLMKKNLSKS